MPDLEDWGLGVHRRVRIVMLLNACQSAGLSPVNVATLHALSYLAEALSPVWGQTQLDPMLLKSGNRPSFPLLQREVDGLVWCGVLIVTRCEYVREGEGHHWAIDADYQLDDIWGSSIIRQVERYPEQSARHDFIRELVFAASSVDRKDLENFWNWDAAFTNVLVGKGSFVNLESNPEPNRTAKVAMRFRELANDPLMTEAELTHLYLAHVAAEVDGA